MNIVVNYYGMALAKAPHKHAQDIMKELGIVYKSCQPQPIADQWVFYDCDIATVPKQLPGYVYVTKE